MPRRSRHHGRALGGGHGGSRPVGARGRHGTGCSARCADPHRDWGTDRWRGRAGLSVLAAGVPVGGVGEAFQLLGDLAKEVWSRMELGLDAAFANMSAGWESLKASGFRRCEAPSRALSASATGQRRVFRGPMMPLVAIWGSLPGAIGDFAFQAANGLISGVEAMLNGVVTRINTFISGIECGAGAAAGMGYG